MSSKTKNKTAGEKENKQAHLEAIRKKKAERRAEPLFELMAPIRPEKPRILIVSEGKNTEPSYFRQFRLSSATIVTVGAGCETIRVVERAEKEAAQNGPFDQVWVVFDKDDFPAANFDNAIFKAEHLGFGVAYSNQAFEYWLVLHFEDHQGGAMHRDDYHEKLNTYLAPHGLFYDGEASKTVENGFFDLMMATDPRTKLRRVDVAIQRAARIFNARDQKSPAAEESSTAVFKLVVEILKFV